MTAARELAQFATQAKDTDIPADRRHEMRRLLLDYLGVALSGSRTDSGQIAATTMIELGGAAQATVIGRNRQIPALHAAFANATSEHSIELDDVDDEALFHYGPPIVSTALAVAEWVDAAGADLITAMAIGSEVMNRLSLATNPGLRDRGFHTTPTCGVFGAAAAAGRLLGLDADAMTSAFGIAGAQASGLMEMYGPSMQKRINPGPAARNAVTAAMLAGNGYSGAETIFEGERGFGFAFAGGISVPRLLAGLGREFTFLVEYKPYSAARPIHNAIDAALELRARGVTGSNLAGMIVYRHPAWSEYHRNANPTTYHEAQMSLPYSTAVALADGSALPPQYQGANLSRADLRRIVDHLQIQTDSELPRGVSCRVVATTTDGQTHVVQVDDPKGSIGNPMSDSELAAKFTMLAAPVLDGIEPAQVVEAAWSVDDARSARDIVALCAAGT